MINILLVDDHDLVRTGIRKILDEENGFKVIAEVATGEEAIKYCKQTEPDIILMDIDMPGIGGLEATKKICKMCPDTKVVMLTAQSDEVYPAKVMKLGAAGFLTKVTPVKDMVNAIRAVHCGQIYLSPEISEKLANEKSPSDDPFSELSERELQIMFLITRGEKATDISDSLNLSSKTVNSYRYRMFEKLNVNNDVELTHLALQHGIIETKKL
ncbi:MAG: UvrY/SirA/GacA family response regulator transcription factor [Colwellia sp.]